MKRLLLILLLAPSLCLGAAYLTPEVPLVTTYSLTMAVTDATGTGSTFTVNSDPATVADTPKTWAGLSSATEAVTFAANTTETSSCTGTGVTGSDPNWVVDMSAADVTDMACTVSAEAGETYLFKYDADNPSGDDYAYVDSGSTSIQATGAGVTIISQTQAHSTPNSVLFTSGAGVLMNFTTGVSTYVTAADLDESSIEIWVYVDQATQNSDVSLFEIYPEVTAGSDMIRAMINANGTVYFRYEANNAVVSLDTTGTVPTQEWVRLRFHISATTIADGQIGVQINSGSWENADADLTPVGTLTANPDTIKLAQPTFNTAYSSTPSYRDDFSIMAGYDTWND